MSDRFRDLVASSRDLIAAIDRAGNLTYVSPEIQQVLGLPLAEVVGQALWELVHPKDVAAVHGAVTGLFERGERRSLEFDMLDASGRWRRLNAALRLLAGEERLEGVLTASEVTERQDTGGTLPEHDAELRQARKMEVVGRLASGISHDFGNLLTVIIGASARVTEALPTESPLRDDMESIRGSAERAASMVRQLLGFGRRQPDVRTVVDLNEIVAHTEALLRRLMGEHIELRTVRAPELWPVRADPVELEQVLLNLAVNARDAMPAGGVLVIETKNVSAAGDSIRTDAVAVSVTDTGIGMDSGTQARAFEPFFTTKEPGKGTGLGLATVQAVISESGGRVDIASAQGQGTTITVTLPRAMAVNTPAASEPGAVHGGDETLLLVEDEDGVRELVRDMLEMAGYRVLEASIPSNAEQISRDFVGRIDMLVTDVIMPESSGLELSSRLRASRPDLRVMYMSGFPEPTAGDGSAQAPGAHFISKPFDRRALLQCVRRALDAPASS